MNKVSKLPVHTGTRNSFSLSRGVGSYVGMRIGLSLYQATLFLSEAFLEAPDGLMRFTSGLPVSPVWCFFGAPGTSKSIRNPAVSGGAEVLPNTGCSHPNCDAAAYTAAFSILSIRRLLRTVSSRSSGASRFSRMAAEKASSSST